MAKQKSEIKSMRFSLVDTLGNANDPSLCLIESFVIGTTRKMMIAKE